MKFLEEHIKFEILYSDIIFQINEKNGTFNQSKEIAEYIYENVFNKKLNIDCSKFNTFFKYIKVSLINSEHLFASYENLENDTVYLEIYCNNQTIKDNTNLTKLIIHELLHAYEDYQLKIKKLSLKDYLTNAYKKSINNLNNRNEVIRNLSRCQYFLNDHEKNAYLGTLEYQISNLFKTYRGDKYDFTKIINLIKQSDVWKEYFKLDEFIQNINKNMIDKELFVNVYNSMNNSSKTLSQIQKEFNYKWKKFNSKFNQLISKIICDTLFENKNIKVPAGIEDTLL